LFNTCATGATLTANCNDNHTALALDGVDVIETREVRLAAGT
jgi:hypothetical protein